MMRSPAASFVATLLLASTAQAEVHAKPSLVADTSAIVAGKPFTVAVVFAIDPDWHLYFKDPGDSGMPPSVKWTLPSGLTAGPTQFPKPEVLKSPAGVNYIYRTEVALLVTITPNASFKADGNVELAASLKWLECNDDQCLPGKAGISIRLPVASDATLNQPARFDLWKAQVKAGESFDPVKEQ